MDSKSWLFPQKEGSPQTRKMTGNSPLTRPPRHSPRVEGAAREMTTAVPETQLLDFSPRKGSLTFLPGRVRGSLEEKRVPGRPSPPRPAVGAPRGPRPAPTAGALAPADTMGGSFSRSFLPLLPRRSRRHCRRRGGRGHPIRFTQSGRAAGARGGGSGGGGGGQAAAGAGAAAAAAARGPWATASSLRRFRPRPRLARAARAAASGCAARAPGCLPRPRPAPAPARGPARPRLPPAPRLCRPLLASVAPSSPPARLAGAGPDAGRCHPRCPGGPERAAAGRHVVCRPSPEPARRGGRTMSRYSGDTAKPAKVARG